MSTDTSRAEWLHNARALLDFLEFHDDLPLPDDFELTHWSWDSTPEIVGTIARALGTFSKHFSETSLTLEHPFGSTCKLRYYFTRSGVCERVEVGKKKERRSRATTYIEEEVEVPVYEYKCPSLMNLGLDSAEEAS
jgi:hypothetical protein